MMEEDNKDYQWEHPSTVSNGDENGDMSSSDPSTDVWDYGSLVHSPRSGKMKIMCGLCGAKFSNKTNRLRLHLSCRGGDAKPCPKAPKEVQLLFQALLDSNKKPFTPSKPSTRVVIGESFDTRIVERTIGEEEVEEEEEEARLLALEEEQLQLALKRSMEEAFRHQRCPRSQCDAEAGSSTSKRKKSYKPSKFLSSLGAFYRMLGTPYKSAHKESLKNLIQIIQEHDEKLSPPSDSGEVNEYLYEDLDSSSSSANESPVVKKDRNASKD